MPVCETCAAETRSEKGLVQHRRAKHPDEVGPIEVAIRRDLANAAGSEALKAVAVRLAAAVDGCGSSRDLPALVRELRQTLSELGLARSAGDRSSDVVDQLAARRRARLAAATDPERSS